jgi:hypothetical protein
MITATCHSTDCPLLGVQYFIPGKHAYVECGACAAATSISDERDDPKEPTT